MWGAFPDMRDWGSGPGLGGWGNEGAPGASATRPDRSADRKILDELNDRVKSTREINSIDVEVRVESGDVTLVGTVPERAMRQRLEELASTVEGVKSIDNQVHLGRADTAAMGSE
jgi:osmotically-inducible protein OsmY